MKLCRGLNDSMGTYSWAGFGYSLVVQGSPRTLRIGKIVVAVAVAVAAAVA